MINLLDTVIETDRFKLIPTSQDFVNDIFKEFTKEITKYMIPQPPSDIKGISNFINKSRKNMSKEEELQVVILDKITGKFLGHAGISKLDTETPELGIWIKKNAHGNKFGREAIYGLKDWAEKNLKYKYLIYPVDKKNIASRKIAEYMGGVIGTEYKKKNMSGNLLDFVEYRIYPIKK